MGSFWSHLRGGYLAPRQTDTECSAAGEFIKEKRGTLLHMFNIEDDLLPEFLSSAVLTNEQYERVKDRRTTFMKIKTLLTEILAEPISDTNVNQFLLALDKTHHKHVSNFIRGNGDYKEEFGDDWPLREEEKGRFDTGRNRIITSLNSVNGLLDEMFTVDGISERLKGRLNDIKDNAKRNEELCAAIRRGNRSSYLKFIECLEKTNQHQIVWIISPESLSGIPPLDENCERLLRLNYAVLTEIIETHNGLIAALFASGCITMRQKLYVESSPLSERAVKLLDIVMRGSQLGYQKFIDCLNKRGQRHVTNIIQGSNVIAELVANIGIEDGEDKTGVEDLIVRRLVDLINSVFENRSKLKIAELVRSLSMSIPVKKQEEFSAKLIDQIDKLQLSAVRVGDSIHLFYSLRSLADFEKLQGVSSSGQLTSDLHILFTSLLGFDEGVHLSLPRLSWPERNWDICARHLYAQENLTTLAGVYELAQGRKMGAICIDSIESFKRFHIELREHILMKAAGELFCVLSRKVRQANIYSLTTLRAVSKEWDMILTNRQYSRRVLRNSFKRCLHPFKRNPRQLSTIHSVEKVSGIAELNGMLYVASSEAKAIRVYTSSEPFEQLYSVTMPYLHGVTDLTACFDTNQLFVAVTDVPAIWRLSVAGYKLIMEEYNVFVKLSWNPLSISITSARLLVTPRTGESLYHFFDDGKILKCIVLPDYMNATHGVEIPHRPRTQEGGGENAGKTLPETTLASTYIVSYRPRKFGDTVVEHNSVSEVNDNGVVVRHVVNPYDCSDVINFNMPYYLSLDAGGYVFVADVRNERVVVVNILPSRLHVKRVLLTSLGGQPRRLCFSRETGLLYVMNWHSTDVAVFSVVQTDRNKKKVVKQHELSLFGKT